MAVEQKYLTGGSDHFDVHVEFLTEEGSAFVSRKLGVELLQGVCRVVSVEEAGADPEVKNFPAVFFEYAGPRGSLTDLEFLAIECLKTESTDPALRAALLDEAMATTQEEDLPVTRDWLVSLPVGFYEAGSSGEGVCLFDEVGPMSRTRIYFLFPSDKTPNAFRWGIRVTSAHTPRQNFHSVPTRRKVFAFCLAVGINLMEKS